MFISVIIPVYNDPSGMACTLSALAKQDYPKKCWEVIVVDNNSTDHTVKTAVSFKDKIPLLHVETESKKSSYAARNKGVSMAKGDILAFVDANITMDSEWLSKGVAAVRDKNADYVGCNIKVYNPGPKQNLWTRYELNFAFPVKQYMQEDHFAPTACIFVKKNIFDEIGLFDDRLQSCGDMEFGNRVYSAGYIMIYEADNRMEHPTRNNLKSMVKKIIRVSNGHFDLKLLYPARYGEINLLSILFHFFPVTKLGKNFSTLKKTDKVEMLLAANFLRYIAAINQLFRFFKFKF